jgi:hypothetical protein
LLALIGADKIGKLTSSVTGFIRKCIAEVVPTVKVRCFPNQKPWINTEVGAMLNDRATTIADNPDTMAEDRNMYKKSCYNLRRVIK